jgi:hypothetical protein
MQDGTVIGYTDLNATGGLSIYALVINDSGQYLTNSLTASFIDFDGDVTHFNIPLTEQDNGYYETTILYRFPEGNYRVRVYNQVGATADLSADDFLTLQPFFYSAGTRSEVSTQETWRAVEALQTKVNELSQGQSGKDNSLAEVMNKLDEILGYLKAIYGRR